MEYFHLIAFALIPIAVSRLLIHILDKNDGKQIWCKDIVLRKDESSDFNISEIVLEPQKPNESRNYQIKVKNIQNYPEGKYNAVFIFETGRQKIGNKLIYELTIYNDKMKNNYFDFENAYKYKDNK